MLLRLDPQVKGRPAMSSLRVTRPWYRAAVIAGLLLVSVGGPQSPNNPVSLPQARAQGQSAAKPAPGPQVPIAAPLMITKGAGPSADGRVQPGSGSASINLDLAL